MTSKEKVITTLHIFLELETNAQNEYEINQDNGVVNRLRCNQTSFQISLSVKLKLALI